MKEIIRVDSVSFSYGSKPALEDVSLHIHEKEIVTIIGPNGGGKTTLLKVILGLLNPQAGRVLIDGNPVSMAGSKLGYVPQYSVFDRSFPMTVFDVVLSGRIKPFGFYSKSDKDMALQSLEDVDLLDKKNMPFSSLSGGQTQRMLIARAVTTGAEILLLDEPTSSIDPVAEKNLHQLIGNLSEKMTILLVTHDTDFVSDITDRVLCVNQHVAEHPLDEKFSEVVSTAYGNKAKLVRHDVSLPDPDCCSEGE
jgi:zinc transport system ATP-binding protein